MTARIEILRQVLARDAGVPPENITDDLPLLETGLLTSLQAVELVDLAESLTGRTVDLDALGPETFRNLRTLSLHLLGAPAPSAPAMAGAAAAPLKGELLAHYRGLDAAVADAARRDGAVEELHGPTLPLETFRRAGWLTSFPHLATLSAPIAERRQADVAASGQVAACDLGEPAALPAASCHAPLAHRTGTTLRARELVSVSGPCWRAEASETALVRQRCFTMREVLILGEPAEAQDFVELWATRLPRLAQGLGVAARLVVANDPFFDPSSDPKARAGALLGSVKRELVDARGVALASVNLHRGYFAGAFEIRHGGGPCWSACVAFGLERWAGALEHASPDWNAADEALR